MKNITVTASKNSDKVYEVEAKQIITLENINVNQMSFSSNGSHLVISSEGNADVILLGFNSIIEESDIPTFILPDGTEVNANDLMQAVALNAENLNDIEPAAGPDSGAQQAQGEGFNSPTIISDTYATNDSISEVIGTQGQNGQSLPVEDPLQREELLNTPNNAPDAIDDTFTTPEDVALNITAADLLLNDFDTDGDILTVTSVDTTTTNGGTVTFDPITGAIVYTPVDDYNGPDSFTYTVSDGNGGTDTATVNIGVTPVNDDPIAVNDNFITDEDVALNITTAELLSNDTDIDGDTLTVTSVDTRTTNGGIVTFDPITGAIIYTPADNYNGPDSFTYTISDGNGGTDTATAFISVTPVNDDPIARNDLFFTREDNSINISSARILRNDSDVDGDTLSVTNVNSVSTRGGSVTFDSTTGAIVYTPANNYNGPDSFTYTISDGNGGTDTATVFIGVIPVNDAPVANNDAFTTLEDSPLNIRLSQLLVNDTDVDGGRLRVTSFESTTEEGGTVRYNFFTGELRYTPADDYNGPDSFTYTISDGRGGTDTATVFISVTPVNDIPDANNDLFFTPEDIALNITSADLLVNDTDADGDVLTVTNVNSVSTRGGSVTFDPITGAIVYTPANDYNGPDSFTYTISDGNGGTDTATVYIGVTSVNDAPIANDDSFTTREDSPLNIRLSQLLVNDTDVDGGRTRVTSYESTTTQGGTVTYNFFTGLQYTPADDYNGPDSFTYTISDGRGGFDTATVNINVTPVNDDPKAENDNFVTDEDVALNITAADLLINDRDIDGDTLTVTSVDTTTTNGGTVTFNSVTGAIVYTPADDYNGPDSFTYTISDGNGGTDTATVNISVTPVVDAAPVLSFAGLCNSFGHSNIELTHDVKISDADSTTLASANIAILAGFQAGDILNLTGFTVAPTGLIAGTNISFMYNAATGVLSLTGVDSISTYSSIIDGLRFNTTAADGTRELDVTVTDSSGEISNVATLNAHVLNVTESGDANDNDITGTSSNNHIQGNDGADILRGQDGDDKLEGNDGNDTLLGGIGDDRLDGGEGNDDLQGEDGDDCLHGDDGDDTLSGGSGKDYLDGGNGTDIIHGGTGNDTIVDTGVGAINPHTYNIVLNIDMSGSMGWEIITGQPETSFDILQQTLINLSNSLESNANNVTITLIQFNNYAQTTTFGVNGYDAFKNYINNPATFTPVGGTNYVDALDQAKIVFDAAPASTDTHHNIMYFISDGVPNFGLRESDLGFDWSDYADANGIESNAIGIGSAASQYLDPIDNTGGSEILASPNDLNAALEIDLIGADLLYGNEGDDYLDGGAGADKLYGGEGEDTLVFDADDTVIDGGLGNDTLLITPNNIDIDFGHFGMKSIEAVNMTDGVQTTLHLDASDVLDTSDTDQLVISGDSGDIVDASEYDTRGADTIIDGNTFAYFGTATNGSSILVEIGLELNGNVITEI